jgi:hypothetical protein
MYTINRSVAILRPQQPFIDWANNLPDAGFKASKKDFTTDCHVILIPEYDTDDEAREYISAMYEDIFEEELGGWCTEESWWPKDRTEKMFWQWFDFELHSMVIDPYVDPIEKEDL